jgi:toxin ParE1/3/4
MPPPLPVIWTARARTELAAVRAWIAADRPRAAERFADRLYEAGEALAYFPERGRAEGRSRVLAIVPPYLIRYRVGRAGVVILEVRHGARRP